MQSVAPGFFTYAPNNGKYIAAQHADGSVVGPAGLFADVASTPAKFGEVIELYATGFGPTNPATPSGQLVTTPAPIADLSAVTVLIGGMRATVTWAGVTMAGLWQMNVQVPSSWLDGDKTVIATIGGQQTQGQAYLSVQRQ
jgi:uncharacterized protein (TIGR03437 family)